MDQDLLKTWKQAVADDETKLGFDAWCRENDPVSQDDFDAAVKQAMLATFGDDAVRRVEADEDPDAYDITVCLSAHQRLTCFVEVTVPGSCDEGRAHSLALSLDEYVDARHYQMDDEYWEDGTPTVDGAD